MQDPIKFFKLKTGRKYTQPYILIKNWHLDKELEYKRSSQNWTLKNQTIQLEMEQKTSVWPKLSALFSQNSFADNINPKLRYLGKESLKNH